MTMDWKSETSPQVNACPWDALTHPAEKKAQPTGMNLYETNAYRHQGAPRVRIVVASIEPRTRGRR